MDLLPGRLVVAAGCPVAPPQGRQMGYTWQGRTGLESGDKERAHTESGMKPRTRLRPSRRNIYYGRVRREIYVGTPAIFARPEIEAV